MRFFLFLVPLGFVACWVLLLSLALFTYGKMFEGSLTALVTPFRDGAVDERALRMLVTRQLAAGTNALVPGGTTGESPTLSESEWERIVEVCVGESKGRIPVIAGCGTNSTAVSVARAQRCAALGADGVMVVTPYYNKPTQNGLYHHFRAIADATPLPLLVYNIPGRTSVDMNVETLGRLVHDCPTVKSIKDASGDLNRVTLQAAACGGDFAQLSGDDISAFEFNRLGGRGCVSVASNLVPELCARFQKLCADKNWTEAQELHQRLVPLYRALFVETNPAPIKYALSALGLCTPEVRLPLVELAPSSRAAVEQALQALDKIA